ncbi:hypothetical protein BD560DRAFT_235806 [Blakeslea trispora]|nr:hypothetical protein BD560DRAFT_235806 [Blakeslea trispora]
MFFLYNKTTPTGIRDRLFQYFYSASEDKPLDEFLKQNKTTLDAFRNMKTSNKKALIDQMSLKMLDNYEHLTNNEKNILKLSLSYIVDMSGEGTDVYKKYISSPVFWRGLCLDVADITEGMNEEQRQEVEELCSTLLEKCKKDVFDGLSFICLEKSKLLKQRMHESTQYQVLQVFEYILENLDICSRNKKMSEAELVECVNTIIKFFLRSTNLYTKTGETVALNTKEPCFLNEYNYSGGDSSSFNKTGCSSSALSPTKSTTASGRKIDLMVKNINDNELAYCEFKANNSKNLCQYQHSKNLRLNQRILIECVEVCPDERVIAFNWEGLFGTFFVLQQKHGIAFANKANDFYVPQDLEVLDQDFVNTVLSLIAWRDHLEHVSLIIKKAAYKPKRSNMVAYPHTCFTAVNEKRRRVSKK